MVDYGNSNYLIIIATAQSGGNPAGDRFYLLAKTYNKRFRNGNRAIELIQGKNFYINHGKRKQTVSINDAILLHTEINDLFSFLDKYACTDTPISSYLYLFIKLNPNSYLKFRDSIGNYQNHLYCVPDDYSVSGNSTEQITKVSLNFSEVSTL